MNGKREDQLQTMQRFKAGRTIGEYRSSSIAQPNTSEALAITEERINYFFILSSYSRLNKSSVLFLGIREISISFSKVDEKFSFKQEEEHELAVASRRNIRAYV